MTVRWCAKHDSPRNVCDCDLPLPEEAPVRVIPVELKGVPRRERGNGHQVLQRTWCPCGSLMRDWTRYYECDFGHRWDWGYDYATRTNRWQQVKKVTG